MLQENLSTQKRSEENGPFVISTTSGPSSTYASVLVAEDNLVNQRVVNWILEKMGCRVTNVTNGREAIEAFSRDAFDLILMDWQMPDLDGLQATRAIRHREAVGKAKASGTSRFRLDVSRSHHWYDGKCDERRS